MVSAPGERSERRTALAATDIDNALRVGVLRQSLRNASLAAAESAGDGARATQSRAAKQSKREPTEGQARANVREEGVEDALSGDERLLAGQLLDEGTRQTHGPVVGHAHGDGLVVRVAGVLQLHDRIDDRVLALALDGAHLAVDLGRHQDAVLHQLVLLHHADDRARSKHVANLCAASRHAPSGSAHPREGRQPECRTHLDRRDGGVLPQLLVVQRGHVDTARHEHALALVRNGSQRALDTVEDVVHDTRAQLRSTSGSETTRNNKRANAPRLAAGGPCARRGHRWSDQLQKGQVSCHLAKSKGQQQQLTSFLVALNGGRVVDQLDDLTDQLVVTDAHLEAERNSAPLEPEHTQSRAFATHQLVHAGAGHLGSNDHCLGQRPNEHGRGRINGTYAGRRP